MAAAHRLQTIQQHLTSQAHGRLQGRVVLVTNVKAFLGTAAVRSLLAEGAAVVAHDASFVTDTTSRQAFAEEHQGVFASAKPLLEGLVEEVVQKHGRIDVLISNDAFPATRMSIDDSNQTQLINNTLQALTVNPFLLSGQVVKQFKKQGGGGAGCKLIFVTSAAPLRGLANYAAYVTARGATNALTLSLAKELAPLGITSNALAPNFVESPTYFPDHLLSDPAKRAKITAGIPLGRLAKPHEAASYLVFLASTESNFVTGQVLSFAGGWA